MKNSPPVKLSAQLLEAALPEAVKGQFASLNGERMLALEWVSGYKGVRRLNAVTDNTATEARRSQGLQSCHLMSDFT